MALNPLGALRRAPFGTYLTDCVEQRLNPTTGVKGMFCAHKPIPADTLVACIPLMACISPATVLATKAGNRIAANLNPEGYSAQCGVGKMDISLPSMLVASFTALSMNKGPLKEYLANIAVDGDSNAVRADLSAVYGSDALVGKYNDLQAASLEVLKAVHKDVTGGESGYEGGGASSTLGFSLEQLIKANALCESRVLSIPTDMAGDGTMDFDGGDGDEDHDLLGGPALVPWFDLVNHSDDDSNIAAAVMPTHAMPEQIQRIAPYCVIGAARRDISVGEEITYEYMEPIPNARRVLDARAYENQLLLWATRFHFIPNHLR